MAPGAVDNSRVLSFDRAVRAVGKRKPNRFRPRPPSDWGGHAFVPSPDVASWIRQTFIEDGTPLYNPDHQHLQFAKIGVVWTGVLNNRQQRTILATCETTKQNTSGAWKKARAEQQLEDWFGDVPDFLITLYAPALAEFDDRSFCAVIEHELFHCAQDTTDTGAPKFHRDGSPMFAIRGHDVEQFYGVVARYGLDRETKALLELANNQPALPDKILEAACGTCMRKAA